eukprot:GFUD01113049.1.p1 GENE.GFUD01113049.1~~GFUD01113049.1.p1  ORF type:complete len:166 (-),score=47.77 GFUD01113049.1:199-696(-)
MKYLICFSALIFFNLAQDASTTWQNSNTKQEENLEKKEGRHLILVTLLQHLNQTGWDPRFGNISYSLYSTFMEENTTQSLLPNRDQDNREQENRDQENTGQENTGQENTDQEIKDQETTTCCKQEDVPETSSVGIRQPAGPMKMSDLFFSTKIEQFMKGLQKTGE